MTLYAYCIRRAGDALPAAELTGVNGAPVDWLREGDLGLWFSGGEPGQPTEQRLREHDRVVRAALRSATPLPLRYGAGVFRDEAAAREALRARERAFAADLQRVAGRVETGLRVGWEPAVLPPAEGGGDEEAGPGRAYLEARRRQVDAEAGLRQAAAALLDRVAAEFRDLELPEARTLLPERGTAGIVAHLVHREELSLYEARVREVREVARGWGCALFLSGPWAPYSFV